MGTFGNTFGFINGGSLLSQLQEPLAIELTWNDILNVPVTDASSVSDWNTFFDLPTNGMPFTAVIVENNVVKLFGGSNITLKDSLFEIIIEGESIANTSLISLIDNGCIIATGARSFASCTGLLSIGLPLVTIGAVSLFDGCLFLNSVSMPSLVTALEACFESCEGIISIDLPNLETAGYTSFETCIGLTTISLPKLITAEELSFAGCTTLETISLPKLITTGTSTFANCYLLETVDLPLCETIGNNTFVACDSLTSLNLASCLNLGDTLGDDFVFGQIYNATINVVVPASLMSCNDGNPDGDILHLAANNTVTINNTIYITTPILLGATIENDTPSDIIITFSAWLDSESIPDSSDFEVIVNSIVTGIALLSVSDDQCILTLNSAIGYGDVVTVSYTQPLVNPLKTISGGKVASFIGQEVINNVEEILSFLFQPVVEDRVRVANYNYTYNGTIYYVDAAKLDDTGNGLTIGTAKKTISAAYSLCVAGDRIKCVAGTYLMSAEAGGYLVFNSSTKDVLIESDSGLKDVIFDQPSVGTFCLRKHATVSLTFKNIIMQTALNIKVFYESTVGNNTRTIFDNCTLKNTNTGSSAGCYQFADSNPTFNRYIEFKSCILDYTSTTMGPILRNGAQGPNYRYLISNSEFISRGGSPTYASGNDYSGDEYIYDSIFKQYANSYVLLFGIDSTPPSAQHGYIDMRGCTAEYMNGAYGHAILFGRGTNNVYCINNKTICNSTDNSANIGLAIKTIASSQENAIFKGNWSISPRPLALKGAINCDIQNNIIIGNNSTYYPFTLINSQEEIECNCSNNKIENNLFYALDRVIVITSATSVSAKTSVQSGTLNNNKYYTLAVNDDKYLYDGNYTAFADRAAYWETGLDSSSTFTTGVEQPV